jgi:hypothetical protein
MEKIAGIVHESRAGLGVRLIAKSAGHTSLSFKQEIMPVLAHDLNPCGGYGNAILVTLNLFQYANNHGDLLS